MSVSAAKDEGSSMTEVAQVEHRSVKLGGREASQACDGGSRISTAI